MIRLRGKNKVLIFFGIIIILSLILLTIYLIIKNPLSRDISSQIANPAAIYCKEKGYQYEIKTNDSGQYGVCILSDYAKCEEWAFFRGECNL